MNENDLKNLIRMAVEIDEIDRGALQGDLAPTNATVIPISRATRRKRLIKQLTWPVAAAVALTLSFFPSANRAPRDLGLASSGSFEVVHCPAVPVLNGKRVDRFRPSPGEKCSVLAVFHSWQIDCQCLAWQVYEWEDGRSFAELTPGQIHDITLDVTDAPPLEQLLVVLIANKSEDLPVCNPYSCVLLDCLNEIAPPTDPRANAAAYASAVRSCVPDSVRVVPHAFYVE